MSKMLYTKYGGESAVLAVLDAHRDVFPVTCCTVESDGIDFPEKNGNHGSDKFWRLLKVAGLTVGRNGNGGSTGASTTRVSFLDFDALAADRLKNLLQMAGDGVAIDRNGLAGIMANGTLPHTVCYVGTLSARLADVTDTGARILSVNKDAKPLVTGKTPAVAAFKADFMPEVERFKAIRDASPTGLAVLDVLRSQVKAAQASAELARGAAYDKLASAIAAYDPAHAEADKLEAAAVKLATEPETDKTRILANTHAQASRAVAAIYATAVCDIIATLETMHNAKPSPEAAEAVAVYAAQSDPDLDGVIRRAAIKVAAAHRVTLHEIRVTVETAYADLVNASAADDTGAFDIGL